MADLNVLIIENYEGKWQIAMLYHEMLVAGVLSGSCREECLEF